MKQADTFDLRRLREDFGADSGFTDAQLLAGLTVAAILDPSRRSIPEDEVIGAAPGGLRQGRRVSPDRGNRGAYLRHLIMLGPRVNRASAGERNNDKV